MSLFDAAEGALVAVKERLSWVVITTLLFTVGAVAINAGRGGWEAQARLVLTPSNENQTLVQLGVPTQSVPSGDELFTDDIIEALRQQVDPLTGDEAMRNRLQVRQDAGPREMTLVGSADDAPGAEALVNAWATIFVRSRNRLLGDALNSAQQAVQSKLDDPSADAQDKRALRAQLAEFAAARGAARGDAQVVQIAKATSSPGRRINEILAFLAGLVVGVILALAAALLDRRLRTRAMAETSFGLPALATLHGDDGAEASRLRSHLELMADAGPTQVVMLTSVNGLDEQSGTASALARAYADAGQRPVLVVWAIDRDRDAPPAGAPDVDGVETVVEAGRWSQLEHRLTTLRGESRVAVVDAPGLVVSGDALVASQRVDACVVCISLETARGDDSAALRRELSGLARQPTGLVILASDRPG